MDIFILLSALLVGGFTIACIIMLADTAKSYGVNIIADVLRRLRNDSKNNWENL